MADDAEGCGVRDIAAERIAHRHCDADVSKLTEFIDQQTAEERMGTSEIIDKLIREIHRAEARGVTRYQLSQQTGIPQSTLSRLMKRERDSLKVETVETLCRELGFVLEMRPTKNGRKS